MIYTIVPLGNPGSSYERTRHNAARIVLDVCKDDVASIASAEVFVPTSFMNESGRDVSDYMRYHEDREVVLLYDDKDLPLGTIRISHDRGDGGHNGVKSVIEQLGTREFVRVRIGIAGKDETGNIKVPKGDEVQKYVMGNFTADELDILKKSSLLVVNALKDIVEYGYQKAMERNN
jgi:PTH1 family peptidyl-tRNA hydrolase